MAAARILLTQRWPEAVEAALWRDYDTTILEHTLSVPEWRAALQEYDAICPCVTDRFVAELGETGPVKTRLLANYGVGYNHINLDAARQLGLTVTNTPGVLTDATADLAMTLLLMVARRAGEGERQLRAGQWRGWYPTHLMGAQVSGATLGIIGLGRIGLAMAHKAHYGFGMSILYHNRRELNDSAVARMGARFCANVDDLLQAADFVAIHTPGGQDTRHLFDARRFAAMRPHAYLINTSRGDVVDENALIAALDAGQIAGAALDVYEQEPRVPAALLERENVVLLPHLGSATLSTRTAMGMKVKANLDAFFSGQPVPDRVL
ncbi:MAG: D-glycerate dehydrogenase [Pseudomonadales bacterium]|jgi:lactate dehydrogenase-like 2-hydroxyacid dehydrogenase|nr:D-glycerate dehydrogenase [Pseudomonadales bacterium]